MKYKNKYNKKDIFEELLSDKNNKYNFNKLKVKQKTKSLFETINKNEFNEDSKMFYKENKNFMNIENNSINYEKLWEENRKKIESKINYEKDNKKEKKLNINKCLMNEEKLLKEEEDLLNKCPNFWECYFFSKRNLIERKKFN